MTGFLPDLEPLRTPPDLSPDSPFGIALYTDGGCKGNPGPGAWAAVSFLSKATETHETHETYETYETHEIWGSAMQTTNNQMELMAVIEGLKALPNFYPQYFAGNSKNLNTSVYTDSQYVKNGISTWIQTWKKNSWRTSNKKPVKNQELWQELERQANNIKQYSKLEWNWVKGHAGNIHNERCDALVRENFPH